MKKTIKIGTRGSQLALWQANQIKDALEKMGFPTELITIKSKGDADLKTPLYQMGTTGVFTRHLDIALLEGKIDVAVHSMKDVPTIPAKGIKQAAVLKRGKVKDLLVYKSSSDFLDDPDTECKIATGSVRRRAQWLHRYPKSIMTGLRGNVNTRLRKVQENDWDGALFAAAGLERIDIRPENSIELDWMLPAPAQGAVLVVCREEDKSSFEACSAVNDADAAICTKIERDFLRALMGGCATPISALARIKGEKLFFEGNILTPDGKEKAEIKGEERVESAVDMGKKMGEAIMKRGAAEIVKKLET